MAQKYYVNVAGVFIGSFDGATPPTGSIAVPTPPNDQLQQWDGNQWVLRAPALLEYTAAARWAIEANGITVAGMHLETDDRSKLMIIGARKASEADPQFTTQWKVSTGIFVTLDAAAIVAVSDAVAAHVAVCFAKEAEVSAQIAAGMVATFAQIDAAFAAVATAY